MIARKQYIERIQSAFQFMPIVVLIGARQVGKTTIMKNYPIIGKSLFVNGQDIEIASMFEQLSSIEQYLKVYLDSELNGTLIIDEFQFIQGISTIMKLLTDKHSNLKIMCSGSNSLEILQKVEESLAGRVRIIEVLSLSFSEYLLFKDEKLWQLQQNIELPVSNSLIAPLNQALQEYLIYGGLPRVALTNNYHEKTEMLNDIYQTYLLRDVRMFIANEYFVGFNKLLRLLAAQIGNLVNINELSRECGLPYKKCEEYVHLLQQMYIIKLIEPFHTNKRKVIGKMNKIYFCDLGLRNMIHNSFNEITFRTDNGALFENYCLLELWRKKQVLGNVHFYRTTNGTEIDFIVQKPDDTKAVECKYKSLEKPISIPSITGFCDEENIKERYLINIDLSIEFKGISFIPAIIIDRI
jgi:uncharacterized protein